MLRIKMALITVQDYDRAIKFYTEKLGFKVETDCPFEENRRWVEMSLPGSETRLAFFSTPGEPQAHNPMPCSNVIFGSNNVKGDYEALLKKGVEFTQPPQEESWGTSALFKDTEGNVFCIGSED